MNYLNWSIFNYKQRFGDTYRVYNTATRGMIDVEVSTYEHIETSFTQREIDDDTKHAILLLINQGYISIHENEWVEFVKQREDDYNKLHGKFMLYHIPSWDCDFRCPYCHYYDIVKEADPSSKVDIQQSALYASQYIKKLYSNFEQPVNISVILYGGEPLLALKKHLDFLTLLSDELKSASTNISVSVITNGFNLTKEKIAALQQWDLKGMQITVDGMPAVHNQRRAHKDGVETFPIIVENIKQLCMIHNVPVTIRINVDEDNLESVPDVLKYLRDYGISKNLLLSLSPVFSNVNVEGAVCDSQVLSGFEKIYQVASELNYPFLFPTTACSYYTKEFLVLANNKAYSCPSMSANDLNSNSNTNEDPVIRNKPLIIKDSCKACIWYPLCGGGCTYQNILHGSTQCMAFTYKMIVEGYMKKYSMINRLIRG